MSHLPTTRPRSPLALTELSATLTKTKGPPLPQRSLCVHTPHCHLVLTTTTQQSCTSSSTWSHALPRITTLSRKYSPAETQLRFSIQACCPLLSRAHCSPQPTHASHTYSTSNPILSPNLSLHQELDPIPHNHLSHTSHQHRRHSTPTPDP